MPTRNSKRLSQAAQASGRPKSGEDSLSQKMRTKLAAARENNGEQRVVPQPAVRKAQPAPPPAMAAPLVEPQKSQEACFLTDDDDHTRADDQNDQHAVASEDEEAQQKQQKQQDDEDAAAAVAAASALTAAAAERAGQLSEEDDEDEDPSVPKPRTGSEIGAEAMDSIIEDFREGAVRQRNKRRAAQDARAAANTVSELNNSGATITSGGGTNGHNHPSKRSKHDTGANSRHKRNIEKKKKPSLFLNKRKDEQPSNGGGSGEGSNEPSGSQMAAMGGAAMDNGSDESGEECKSAQQPLPVEKKSEEWDDEDDRTEDESPRKRRRGDGSNAAAVDVDTAAKEKENDEKQQQRQKNKNKTTFAQEPWVMMPPPPPAAAAIRGGQQQPTRNQTNAVANTANTTATPTDLHKCASSLSSMHSYYTNAQHHFMSQMQDIMAVAMDHHTNTAVAATGTATATTTTAPGDLLAADDIAAISRACATALGIINNIGAAPGPAAAAAAFFATGGIANIGNLANIGNITNEMMLPTRPLSALDSASAPVVVANTAATNGGGTQLLGTMPALPLPLPLSLYLPTSASAPPHPLQRQLSNGMDLALLHATAAINGGGVGNVNGAIDAMNAMNASGDPLHHFQFGNFFDGGNLLVGGGVGVGDNQQFQKMLGSMVPVVGGASMIDPTSFPGGLPLAAMQMAPFPIHLQMAAAAAAGQGIAVPPAQPAQAGN